MLTEPRSDTAAVPHRRIAAQTLLLLVVVSAIDIISSNELSVWKFVQQVTGLTWLFDSAILAAILALYLTGRQRTARGLTYVYLGLITLATLGNVGLIIFDVSTGKAADKGTSLLWDTIIVWVATLLVFAVWYWLLDAGGPEARHADSPARADLVVPQQGGDYQGWNGWRPGLTEYIFHSLAASAAFSPGDVQVMSHRFKWLQTVQTLASLLTLTMLAAKAVDLL
jgi:hypothetical protein